jgi:hypothetical protein
MVFCVFTQSTAMNQAKLFFSTHTRLYSHVHSHHRRQGARGQYLGPAAHQVRCLLLARSRVSRFPSTACDSSSRCLFVARAKSNTEFKRRVQAPLFQSRRQSQLKHRVRPNRRAVYFLFQQGLSSAAAARGGQGRVASESRL